MVVCCLGCLVCYVRGFGVRNEHLLSYYICRLWFWMDWFVLLVWVMYLVLMVICVFVDLWLVSLFVSNYYKCLNWVGGFGCCLLVFCC